MTDWKDLDETTMDLKAQPWDGQSVLIALAGEKLVGEAYYDHERDEWNWANTHWTDTTGHSVAGVTHWMPLPTAPVKQP